MERGDNSEVDEPTLKGVKALALEFSARHELPGLAFGVVRGADLVMADCHGWADQRSHLTVVPETVFRIASMTKSLTATCVLMLRDEDLIALDRPIKDYLDGVELADRTRDAPEITVRSLLTMSAGLMEDDPWADRLLDMPRDAFRRMLAAGLPVDTPPGECFEYSNLGFAILGQVVEAVSGSTLAALSMARLLRPLGMQSTYWEIADVPDSVRARGHRGKSWEADPEPPLHDGAFGAMGGLATTVADFARYVSFQLDAWPARDEPDPGPLRRSSRREMQQPQRLLGEGRQGAEGLSSVGYGFGFLGGWSPQYGRVVFHSGGLPGFGSHVEFLPDCDLGVFAFANRTYAPMRLLVREIIDELGAQSWLVPRAIPVSAALLAAQTAVVRAYETRDPADLESLAAPNLFLDRSLASRLAELEDLHSRLGRCVAVETLRPQGRRRGRWRMSCSAGAMEVSVWLAPTAGDKIQVLAVEPVGGGDFR